MSSLHQQVFHLERDRRIKILAAWPNLEEHSGHYICGGGGAFV